jgi:hypothetical protein
VYVVGNEKCTNFCGIDMECYKKKVKGKAIPVTGHEDT